MERTTPLDPEASFVATFGCSTSDPQAREHVENWLIALEYDERRLYSAPPRSDEEMRESWNIVDQAVEYARAYFPQIDLHQLVIDTHFAGY